MHHGLTLGCHGIQTDYKSRNVIARVQQIMVNFLNFDFTNALRSNTLSSIKKYNQFLIFKSYL